MMYRVNSDIRSCITELQDTAGKSGYKFRKWVEASQYYKDINDSRIESILNFGKGFDDLKRKIIKNIELSEMCFIEKLYHVSRQNEVVGLRVLDPRFMSIVSDDQYNPIRYIYRDVKTHKTIQYSPDDLYHFTRETDHDNPMFGMSRLEGLVNDILGDEQSAIYNAKYFLNDGLPSALYIIEWVTDDAEVDILEQYIKDELTGAENKHKAIISPAIKDVKTISSNHDDMKFLEGRRFTTERVCAALKVPKTIINYSDHVNIGNSDNNYKKFIENTVRPLERYLEQIFNTIISDLRFTGVEFYIIDEHINDIEIKSKVAQWNVDKGIWTRNEARTFIGSSDEPDNTDLEEYTVTGAVTSLTLAISGQWGWQATPTDPALNPDNIPS